MKRQLKKYFFYLLIGAGLYFILAYHYIYTGGSNLRMVKKVEPNLHYTFFSIENKRPETIMKIDVLRENGIGDILVEEGLLTEAERDSLERKYANQ